MDGPIVEQNSTYNHDDRRNSQYEQVKFFAIDSV